MTDHPDTLREARELREIVDRLRGLTAGACLACQREQHPREVSELCVSADEVDRIAGDLEYASRSVAAALAERDWKIAELRARCAELEADRERLDYLIHVGSDGVRQGENANWSVGREDWTWVESDNLRAAIDAARRQEPDDADR